MRGYGYSDPMLVFMPIVMLIVAIIMLAAWLVSISKLIEIYKQKHKYGKSASTGILWFIGIFASPIVLGLYVCALPDSSQRSSSPNQKSSADQLPSI